MHIRDVKKAYAAQMDLLREQKGALATVLKKPAGAAGARFDRVEISRQLSALDEQYIAVKDAMARLLEREAALQNAQAAREQGSAEMEQMKELLKILEIYRRLSSGGEVPLQDEERLMEYSPELYMAAKTLAILKKEPGKKYDSLWDGERDRPAKADGDAPPLPDGTEASAPPEPPAEPS